MIGIHPSVLIPNFALSQSMPYLLHKRPGKSVNSIWVIIIQPTGWKKLYISHMAMRDIFRAVLEVSPSLKLKPGI